MKKGKIFGLIIVFLLVLIQFVPTGLPDTIAENENDLLYNNQIPEQVAVILKTSCYDCHSNETNYPWYSYVAPVSWLVGKDIREGREELNFSEWESLSKIDKAKHLDNIIDEVSDGDMPMNIYTIIHTDAKLSSEEIEQLANWAEDYAESLFE
ncbi:MAG: cytochrome C [Bacteroidetes bacterium]|nr:MAG: cytochrome C [Bacteroidota bacterium]